MERKNERTNKPRKPIVSYIRYKSSLLNCIPSLRLLAFIVLEKSLTKNLTLAYMERRKNERTNKPRKPIVSYMIQVIITALHTKFEASSFYSS